MIGTHDCSKCYYCRTDKKCYKCIDYHYQLYKVGWSNEDKDIDSLINELALAVINTRFQWIPFERFTNVEYLPTGRIYKATWLDGPILKWDHEQNKFKRWGEFRVVLKSLRDSKQITSEFRNEVKINNF